MGELEDFRGQVTAELSRRAADPSKAAAMARAAAAEAAAAAGNDTPHLNARRADRKLVSAMRALVDLESDLINRGETFKAADEGVVAQPDLMAHRVIAHFQQV